MIIDRNDTYTWLLNTVQWAADNCSTFCCDKPINSGLALEPYIVREPENLHYTFTFEDERDAMLFAIKWL